jgi:hypothetical protein
MLTARDQSVNLFSGKLLDRDGSTGYYTSLLFESLSPLELQGEGSSGSDSSLRFQPSKNSVRNERYLLRENNKREMEAGRVAEHSVQKECEIFYFNRSSNSWVLISESDNSSK